MIEVLRPYGDNESQVTDEIVELLKSGWEVMLVYGGNRPTVILGKGLKKNKENDAYQIFEDN